MQRESSALRITSLILVAMLLAVSAEPLVRSAEAQTQAAGKFSEEKSNISSADEATGNLDQYFKGIYRNFYSTYRLGADDELAIRVLGQPDYSLEKVTISPVGRVYHPLIGDVDVAGLTVNQLNEKLTADLSQYIIDPKVSVSLLSANSSKIGVLGEVGEPGIIVMARPMSVLDAISASGGFTDFGSKSNVTLLREVGDGRQITRDINIKRILEGKANPEENVRLQAGDTIIVHGNKRKTLSYIMSLTGFGYFLNYMVRGGRSRRF